MTVVARFVLAAGTLVMYRELGTDAMLTSAIVGVLLVDAFFAAQDYLFEGLDA